MLEGWGPLGEPETQQGGQLNEWELFRALNLEEESSGYRRWSHVEQVYCTKLPKSIVPTYPYRSHFRKDGVKVRVNFTSHQKEKKNKNSSNKRDSDRS